MELVPSRYDEMPTLVPIFDEGKWQTVDKSKRKVFREDELKKLLCVHVHTFYVPELKKILSSLQKYNELIGGLIITTNIESEVIMKEVNELIEEFGYERKKCIIKVKNTGRNIKPMFIDAWSEIERYKYCIHMHTKKTVSNKSKEYGKGWLESIIYRMTEADQLAQAVNLMEEQNKIGMIVPKPYEQCAKYSLGWAGNYKKAMYILNKYINECRIYKKEISEQLYKPLVFPVGGMMIFRTQALAQCAQWVRNNQYLVDINEPLPGQSYLHGIERLMVIFIEMTGYNWCLIDCTQEERSKFWHNTDHGVSCIRSEKEIYQKLANAALFDENIQYRRIKELETKLRYSGMTPGKLLVTIKDMLIKYVKNNKNRFPSRFLG